MSKNVHRIFKGAGIVFFGSVIGLCLRLLSKVLIARSVSISDFGIYSLASVVFSIAFVLSLLGLEEGTPRQIAYFRRTGKVNNIVSSSLIISAISGIIVAALMFIYSDNMAIFFNKERLSFTIKFFSLALPFSVLTSTFLAIFRGFEMPRIRVYFSDVLKNGIFVGLLLIVFVMRLSLIGVLVSYVISILFTFICLAVMMLRKINFELTVDRTTTADLLKFSLPLLVAIILGMVMAWTDTLMLGYLRESKDVGLYSASHSLAGLIPIFLSSAGYMYIPVASQICSEGLIDELGRIYKIVTKWIFSVTIPFFIILILYPKFVLGLFFGESYASACNVLRILSLGFMFHVVVGLNGASLIVLGGGRLLMYMTLIGAVSNVILNIFLIPMLGIIGAAVATAISYVLANTMASIKLFQLSGIQPFTRNYLKLLVASMVSAYPFMYLVCNGMHIIVFTFIMYCLLYFIIMIILRCIDREDIKLISAVEDKIGLNFKIIRLILNKLYK